MSNACRSLAGTRPGSNITASVKTMPKKKIRRCPIASRPRGRCDPSGTHAGKKTAAALWTVNCAAIIAGATMASVAAIDARSENDTVVNAAADEYRVKSHPRGTEHIRLQRIADRKHLAR